MLRRAIYLIPFLVGLVIGAVIYAGYLTEAERHDQKTRLQVFYKLSTIQNSFESALTSKLSVAKSLSSYIALAPELDEKTFVTLAKGLITDPGGIRVVEMARDNVITHVYPESEAPLVMGRDLFEDYPGEIRALAIRAIKTRQVQIAAPEDTIEGGSAIIATTPVYVPSRQESGSEYWGVINIFIDTRALYREAGLVGTMPGLDLALRKPEPGNEDGRIMVGELSVFDRDPVVMNIPTADGFWQVAAVPSEGWPPSPNKAFILGSGAIGVVVIMFSLWAALYMVRGRFKAREEYRYLVQNAKSIILRIDMSGNIVFSNEHADEFYGYDSGELIGKPLIGTLIPEKNLEGEPMKRYINRLLRNPSAHPFNETMNVCKNGEIVWVAWANQPVLNDSRQMKELLSVGTDITDRKLMEESLRQREKQYRLLAENVSDVIWGLDADSRFTFVSASDETLRGFKRHDVLSRPVSDFLTPASRRLFEHVIFDLDMQVGDNPNLTADLEFLCRDGSTVWLETRIGVLFNDDGEKIGIQGVGRDITDRKLAEALRDDVERMARHDLKTPLGAVIGLPGEVRRQGNLTDSQNAMLDTIEHAGKDMLQLINRSLDLFKMERGTYVLQRELVDVLEIMETIKTESRPVVREKGISFGVEVLGLPDDKVVANVERDLFKSMLSNLVLNALEASPVGKSVLVILDKGERMTITVRNHGEVPESVRETFFDKYTTGDNAGGSGLGTYSARLIARTHGGDISVDTCMEGETCVVVSLPL